MPSRAATIESSRKLFATQKTEFICKCEADGNVRPVRFYCLWITARPPEVPPPLRGATAVSCPELLMVKAKMLVEVPLVAKSSELEAFIARLKGLDDAAKGLPLTGLRAPVELSIVKAEMSLPPKSAEKRNFPEGSTRTDAGCSPTI